MKKLVLLSVVALLSGVSAAFASSPSECAPGGSCPVCCCREIIPNIGESVAAAQKRVMAADLARLIAHYVSDADVRSELLATMKKDPERAVEHAALAKAAFSEADRACFKRVSDHFKC